MHASVNFLWLLLPLVSSAPPSGFYDPKIGVTHEKDCPNALTYWTIYDDGNCDWCRKWIEYKERHYQCNQCLARTTEPFALTVKCPKCGGPKDGARGLANEICEWRPGSTT
ncbi:hypothetical protein PCANC_19058 [Puccinia coronata f. sp. avenae]|uniref:Uncharacterized protein n=1 Tax=Puccinia coronata f. sp. avenae TaxID=200324 RepID=A0A2N5UD09_9BASI|nr:hypothetical protein PCANC_19058 [Puccinia coronata f. sp. avenae]